MKKNFLFGSFESIQNVTTDIEGNVIYFRLHGRLGNQLFELSEAHFLHLKLGATVILDISRISQSFSDLPEWVKFAEDWDWCFIFMNTNINFLSETQEFFDMSTYREIEQISGENFFEGFRPSVLAIAESGLFQKGKFPFLIHLEKSLPSNSLAISVRIGDYQNNPHLGVLPSRYYRKSFKIATSHWRPSNIYIFSDDLDAAAGILSNFEYSFNYDLDRGMTPMQSLLLLSKSDRIIVANSTFSFWGAYFSSAKVFFPNPFYIALPKWHKNLLFNGAIEIRHTHFSRLYYYGRLLLSYQKRHSST